MVPPAKPPAPGPARFDPARAGLALAEAFRDGEPISALPDGAAPRTAAQARRIAAWVVDELGLAAVGFRTLADGTTGPLLEPRLAHSGVSLPRSALPNLSASAAVLFLLAKPLPASATPYTARRVLGALAPGRAAIDLASWRTASVPQGILARGADLAGLGQLVVADAARASTAPDPAALRIAWNDGPVTSIDASPLLLAAAEAAREAGGLPAGAALVVAGLSAAIAAGPGVLSCRLVGGGRAEVTLV